MTVRVSFDESTRRFLHTTGQCYPYAYGYLASQIRGYLDGDITPPTDGSRPRRPGNRTTG